MTTRRSALEAKLEAQKIAFGPVIFQAVAALRELGILALIAKHKKGISITQISEILNISHYGVSTLLEVAACAEVVVYVADEVVALTTIGFVLNTDKLTEVNFNFVKDVCYEGGALTTESIRTGKPEGLKVFGPWKTVYEGLSQLPDKVKKSWFGFDHYYSDDAFPEALKIVFAANPKVIFDIGGNTGKWAIACCKYNPTVRVKILDLPGQLAVAKKNASEAGFADRIEFHEINLLDPAQKIPSGADAVWMSQFLDCFSADEIVHILKNVRQASNPDTNIYIMEPFIDNQKFPAAAYCLTATSLYFTTIANGNSKMYAAKAMQSFVESAGLTLAQTWPLIDESYHTIMKCKVDG